MVNYKRVVCEVALLFGALSAIAAAPACDHKDHKVTYDQRQNGSENYRLNIDGVIFAVAPAESFLSAMSDIDFSDLLDLEALEQELKPKPPTSLDLPLPKPEEKPVLEAKPEKPTEAAEKPAEAKPEESKPQEAEEKPEAPSKLDDVSVEPAPVPKSHKKSAQLRKQETSQRLKQRIASMFLPFLRQRRHQ